MDEIIPSSGKQIAKTGGVVFALSLATWFLFTFPYLHGGVAVFAALLTTPLVSALWYRFRALKKIGIRFLPRREALRLYGWAFLVFVSIFLFICSLEYLRGRSAFAALKRQVEQDGRSLSLESVIPPSVPDDQNFCAIPLLQSQVELLDEVALFNHLEPLPSPHHERIKALHLPKYGDEWMFARLADLDPVRKAMLANTNRFKTAVESDSATRMIIRHCESQTALRELHEARSRPHARWNLPYESGWFVNLASTARDSTLRGITQTLRLRALAALAERDSALALDDVMICSRLADSLRREPSPFAFSLRHQLFQWTIAPIWEGLARRSWSQNELAQLQERLGEMDLIADASEHDRITAIVWMYFWQDTQNILTFRNLFAHWSQLLDDPGKTIGITLMWNSRPSGWSYLNMVNTYHWLNPAGDPAMATKPIDPMATFFFVPKYMAIRDYRNEQLPLLHLAYTQARVACALERYWLKHETYPEDLDSLVPEWIAELPSLSYRRTPNGRYLLHSAQRKSVRDEFQPLVDRSQRRTSEFGDSVWRYPSDSQ